MRHIVKLERDSNNSAPGEAEVSVYTIGPPLNTRFEKFVQIKLDGLERIIVLSAKDLRNILDLADKE